MKKLSFEEYRTCLLICLIEFDNFCKKNHLQYFLVCGTLLGSIRHKGFIPWDDDIDVAMPFYDYQKMMKMVREEKNYGLSTLFKFDTISNNSHRWSVNDCALVLNDVTDSNGNKIGIGITPFDKIPENKILKKFYRLYARAIICIAYSKSLIGIEKNGLFKKTVKKIINFIYKNVSHVMLEQKLIKFKNYFNNSLKRYNVGNVSRSNEIHQLTLPIKTIKCSFETEQFDIPAGYDSMLKENYGNYLELPPESERIHPHDGDVAFCSNDNLYSKIIELTSKR